MFLFFDWWIFGTILVSTLAHPLIDIAAFLRPSSQPVCAAHPVLQDRCMQHAPVLKKGLLLESHKYKYLPNISKYFPAMGLKHCYIVSGIDYRQLLLSCFVSLVCAGVDYTHPALEPNYVS